MVRQQDESPAEYAADADFHARVRRAERGYIRARRQAAARTPRERTSPGEPEHDAIGLAFSGGGIRSATFNLGVLQALHAAGFFAHVDYLSTVSGGGFVGASLSHAMRRPGAGFPFASRADDPRVDGPVEAPAVSYLRTRSNYLAPQGVPDLVRLVAVLMRGLLVNLLFVVLPILALIATLAAVVYGPGVRAELLGHPFAPVRLMPGAIAIALAWVALHPVVVAFAPDETARKAERRDLYERSFAVALVFVTAAILLDVQRAMLPVFHRTVYGDYGLTGFITVVGVLSGTLWPSIVTMLRGRARTVALAIAAVAGPLLGTMIYLYFAHALILPEAAGLGRVFGLAPIVWVPALAGVILLVAGWLLDVNSTSMHGFYRDRLMAAYLFERTNDGLMPADEVALSTLATDGCEGPYHVINATLNLQGEGDPSLRGRQGDVFEFAPRFVGSRRTGYICTQRYERAQRQPSLGLGAAMAISGAAAAPNMGLLTRPSLVVLLGLLNVRLGLWVPNPARMAPRPERRSAWWRPGPIHLWRELLGRLNGRGASVNVSDGGHLENLGIYGLLRRRCRLIVACDAEADPDLTCRALATVLRYARLDMGVEVDISPADLHLDAHGRSRRHLAVGRIHYPADARYALEPMVGWLVYVKSSFVGEEDALVHDYRRTSPTFPHETTADQFFSEEQFEAYRALGHHIAAAVFGDGPPLAIGSTPRADAIDAWAEALAARLRGDARCSTATGSTPAE